jgi:hypothetical protein
MLYVPYVLHVKNYHCNICIDIYIDEHCRYIEFIIHMVRIKAVLLIIVAQQTIL